MTFIQDLIARLQRRYENVILPPGLIGDVHDILTKTKDYYHEEGKRMERTKHAREVNRILNRYSKPIAEGGLDYVKAFEAMEKYEHELFRPVPETEVTTPKV